MPNTCLTKLGLSKLAQASGDDTAVGIKHVALGDADGNHYAPDGTETELRNERHRKAIDSRQFHGENNWLVKADFDTDTPIINVREVGFFDGEGDLIVICTFNADEERKTGAVIYSINEVLNFSNIKEGLIYVDAPDDEAFELAVSVSTALANLQHEQLRQADKIHALANQH